MKKIPQKYQHKKTHILICGWFRKIYVLSFTVEIVNLHKIRLFIFILNLRQYEWDILYTSNLRIFQRIGKNMFSARKNWILKNIGDSVLTTENLALEKAVNIYINYLKFYPSKQHVKWKQFKYTSLRLAMISRLRFHGLSCLRFFHCQLSDRYVDMKMYCPSITILGYTSQRRKLEKFIKIHLS